MIGRARIPLAAPGEVDVDALARLLDERLADVPLTPAERSEVLCIALGVGAEASAAARGVAPATIRARRRRIRRVLDALRH